MYMDVGITDEINKFYYILSYTNNVITLRE